MAELCAALCGPGIRYRPLRHNGTPLPDHRPPVAAADTIVRALHDGWALVAPLAGDLVVFDLDGCAVPGVLEALEALEVEHRARLAYRAASGSPNSEHRAYAVPEQSRGRFRAAVMHLRDKFGADGIGHRRWSLEDRTADQSTRAARAGRGLRLPLSPSLKQAGGPVVWPLDRAGLPLLSLEEAARMVRAARAAAGMPTTPAPAAPLRGEQPRPVPSSPRGVSGAPTVRCAAVARMIGGWSPGEREALEAVHPVGQRSDGALAALRVVVRRCGESWTAARDLVMSCRAFGKFAARGEAAARRWWEREAARHAAWLEEHGAARLEATTEEWAAVGAWLSAAWSKLSSRYSVERAGRAWRCLVHIGQRVMLDGRGCESRRVAVRDLVVFGAVSSSATAWRALRDLETAGVLLRSSSWSVSAPLEAVRWSVPGWAELRGDIGETVPHSPLARAVLSPALTADNCGWMSHGLWSAWCITLTGRVSAAGLSEVLQCSVRSVRRWLRVLAGAGLVAAAGGVWSAVAGAAGALVGDVAAAAVVRLEEARARVEVERGLWRSLVAAVGGAMAAGWSRSARPSSSRSSWRSGPAPGDVLEAVAVEYGGRDGWPCGEEAALFGLSSSPSGARGGPARVAAG